MGDIITDLYKIVEQREAEREEGSYTVYLLDAGLDKILKKLGEETAETIIAAKNAEAGGEETRGALIGEVSDLIYHLVVMLYELGVEPDEIETLLRERMQKQKNLKT